MCQEDQGTKDLLTITHPFAKLTPHSSKLPVQSWDQWPRFLTAVHICLGIFSFPMWSISLFSFD